jgi:hypothetical protein
MEIEFELTLQDIEAFSRFHQKHGPKLTPHPLGKAVDIGFGIMTALLLIAFCFSWFLFAGDWKSQYLARVIAGACAGVIVGHLMTLKVLRWLRSKVIVPNTLRLLGSEDCRWYLARRRFKIDPGGFEIANEFYQLRYSWSTVELIDSTSEHVFFYLTLHRAHIVPRHAFQSRRDFEDFLDLACRYHKGLCPRESTSTAIMDALPAKDTGITFPRHP